ncbi:MULTISPECIES: calcineurin-like phosphoesterase family protein [unclassified Beijerinckia]|uniref:calcineurin-like phosphoesterase C-terminal domain-containing protein n=1 Tax=unclassified Beijerinckia TaxID=2638183 RepID=UPI000896DEA0|nr:MULTISPECIES: calcineurin-like phosphoesterase family protein [unclassified Beijerinckia]MDH7794820.1 hypothetical protein [Beijerinckia sp. GAS462]SEB76477.1 N terminal of Calcineurin-like phosphoesterase [Beijerinckia sp. 28-YEA-48]
MFDRTRPLLATRRDLLLSSAALASFSALSGLARASEPVQAGVLVGVWASGRVLDVDRDVGLPGVLVSNGLDIVASDNDGRYVLPEADDGTLFVIKPAHYHVAVDPLTGLPQHYRPYGASAGPSDFRLRAGDEPARFDVALFADPQPETHRHIDYIRDGAVRDVAKALQLPAFGLTLGDICGDNLALLDRLNLTIGQAGVPWWNAGGNHDLDYGATTKVGARRTFRQKYGPSHYAFHYGPALFVVLDNVDYEGARADGSAGRYRGALGARQLTFVRNLLKHWPRDRLVVFAMHIPLTTAWNPRSTSDNTADAEAFLRVIDGYRAVSFSGHMHTTEHGYLPQLSGVPHHHHVLAAVSGSWWSGPNDYRGTPLAMGCDGCPAGYHRLSVSDADYTTTFRAPAVSERLRLHCTVGDDTVDVIVNLFDGGPRSTLFAATGSTRVEMTKVRRADPFVESLFADPSVDRPSWVKAEPSEHLWHARLPLGSALAPQRIAVEAYDEYGQHVDDMVFVERAVQEMAVSHG